MGGYFAVFIILAPKGLKEALLLVIAGELTSVILRSGGESNEVKESLRVCMGDDVIVGFDGPEICEV